LRVFGIAGVESHSLWRLRTAMAKQMAAKTVKAAASSASLAGAP